MHWRHSMEEIDLQPITMQNRMRCKKKNMQSYIKKKIHTPARQWRMNNVIVRDHCGYFIRTFEEIPKVLWIQSNVVIIEFMSTSNWTPPHSPETKHLISTPTVFRVHFCNGLIDDLWVMKPFTVSKRKKKSTQQHMVSAIPVSNDCNSPSTVWVYGASHQRGAEVNTLEDRTEKESSTKDGCNAIRMNKRLFNEEASLPLTFPLPLFWVGSKSSRASKLGLLETWVGRVKAQSNHLSKGHFFVILHHVKVRFADCSCHLL